MGRMVEAAIANDQRPEHALRALRDLRPLYILPADPLATEVLIPAFQVADKVDCMVGFFASSVLTSLAPGLATYLKHATHRFHLIISPILSPDDLAAIEAGTTTPEAVASGLLDHLIITEDLLQQHTLRCLTWLLRHGRIEIKVALMKDALFHPKVWLFEESNDTMAVHGSSNVTYAGIQKNVEQIAISKDWEDANQRYITDKLRYEFDRLWENKEEDTCIVIPIPQAIKEQLLRTYNEEAPPTEQDLRDLYRRAKRTSATPKDEAASSAPTTEGFAIPHGLVYESGPFAHQGSAVRAWINAGHRGILEMATGSGKTITSMIGAYLLHAAHSPLLIVVAAPYVPLIEQWMDEIQPFGIKPTNLTTSGGAQQRANDLQRLKRRLRTGSSTVEAVVVSHDTLCTTDFSEAVASFPCGKLLIADEAHNLGRESFITAPPACFEYRLGLSATPIRQYDQEGTDALFAYFGPVLYTYSLQEAIGHCLVEYEYYVHPVTLSANEMDAWYELTAKIKENAWRAKDNEPDDYLAKLLRDRRAILETAEGKISTLRQLLTREDLPRLRHTLIYTSDKGPDQLQEVNRVLREAGVLFHQLTAEETGNREDTRRIIRSFQTGEIQVLTAKRVLDEGVNIPQICTAFFLASTTVERQWIQRRGRLLRTCKEIGKTHSVIHDFLALPPGMEQGLDPDARALIRSELRRAVEFARLAKNAGRTDGPLAVLDALARSAYL